MRLIALGNSFKTTKGRSMQATATKTKLLVWKVEKSQRYLRRKKRSCWPNLDGLLCGGKIIILNGTSPEESCQKNFRMSREDFMELVTKLRA